jgi:glycosyltransferase involved in cell wall biosynthesis
MKVVLATGIYPPDIGGPSTYVHSLAKELSNSGVDVIVITYMQNAECRMQNAECAWQVESVSKRLPIIRWFLYAWALRKHGKNADIVYCFSSISCGVPLMLCRLLPFGFAQDKPKLMLRLGGDFIWERYTAMGGMMGLNEWYESVHWSVRISHRLMYRILCMFDYIVFSTDMQRILYERFYQSIPSHSCIENAIPDADCVRHIKRDPFRLLFVGRFVGFKNIPALIEAVLQMPHVRLTLVGDGPILNRLKANISRFQIGDRVHISSPVRNAEGKTLLFAEHDLLIISSITEISPNIALEAQAAGIPVLLTKANGLSEKLSSGMIIRDLKKPDAIVRAVLEVEQHYEDISDQTCLSSNRRTWNDVCKEHMTVFKKLI